MNKRKWPVLEALAPALLLASFAVASTSASTAIGTISSTGRFELGGAETWNEGTLLEGSTVSTKRSPSRLRFQDGADVRVGALSKARAYRNRFVLESGAATVELPESFTVEVEALGIRVSGGGSQAQLQVGKEGTTTIASLRGVLHVAGSNGMVLANLTEGNAVQLSPSGPEAKASAQLTGLLHHKNGVYFLSDETTGVTVDLRGELLAKFVGRRVTIIGDVDPAAQASENGRFVVNVHSASLAGGDSVQKKAGGMSRVGKVTIIGGIAVAGAVSTGLVVAGEEETPEAVSPQP